MGPRTRFIAFIAACLLAQGAVQAEPAEGSAGPRISVSPVFADSFGQNSADRAFPGKEPSALPRATGKTLPAADSFGLNKEVLAPLASCSAGVGAMAAAQGNHPRCIEI